MRADNPQRLLPSMLFGAVLVGFGVGCGGLQPAPSAAPTVLPSASSAPTATPPAPTLLNPAPDQMLGKWRAKLADDDIITLNIGPTGIRITRFFTSAIRLEVFGDEAVLSHSNLCEGAGRYRWAIDGETLRFDSVSPDPCDGRQKSFDGVTFTRVES